MAAEPELLFGTQPGLRFAALLDGKGGCRDLDWDGIRAWKPADGYLWVHLERNTAEAQDWVLDESGIERAEALALLADESRPRVQDVGDSLLVVMRGVNFLDGSRETELVPIHIWAEGTRLISLRDREHSLTALRDIRRHLVRGRGPRGAGHLFVQITAKVIDHVEPMVEDLEDEVDLLEDTTLDSATADWRPALSRTRRQAIHLRRYLGPQREALYRLQTDDAAWLRKGDKILLREVYDRVVRHIESLDSIRDRTTILHEDLTSRISEEIAKISNRFTLVAAMLLPPSLVAGMLGANLAGIPGHDWPWAFLVLVGLILTMLPLQWLVLRWMKWL
ncbi:MAG: zinc transporter ZntB [Magnetospirillum sp. WYHS-4]